MRPSGGGPHCVLCGGGLLEWDAQEFIWQDFSYRYLRCGSCRSLVCYPMPQEELLRGLYGSSYAKAFPGTYEVDPATSTERVLGELRLLRPGTFVDYGCGDGSLLRAVAAEGWKALGVELDPEVAKAARRSSGCEVTSLQDLSGAASCDVLHLGDVLEHLPDPLAVLTRLVEGLSPSQLVLAQGPLEAGPSLFSALVRPGRRRRQEHVSAAPYHLIQASAVGQRRFFERAGLVERRYETSEVDWPAPSRLRRSDLAVPRTVALFALRRVSRLVAFSVKLASATPCWGNRYRYAGYPSRKTEVSAEPGPSRYEP
jgi:SAM-dependent methyltransferase